MNTTTTSVADLPPWSVIGGPPLISFALYWGLFGILSVQVYIYHICFPKDSAIQKSLVYGIFSLDTAQTFLLTIDVWDNFIVKWNSSDSWASIGLQWLSIPIMCGLMSIIVQMVFAWRLWLFTKSRILCGVIILLALCHVSAAIVGGIQLKSLSFSEQGKAETSITVWLAGSVTTDVIIAISMTISLLRSKNGFHRSDVLVNRLVGLVVETGTVTASVGIIHMVLFLAKQNTLLHEVPGGILAKVYSNTLLAVFNNRALIHRGDIFRAPEGRDTIHGSYNMSSRVERGRELGLHNELDRSRSAVRINVCQESVTVSDCVRVDLGNNKVDMFQSLHVPHIVKRRYCICRTKSSLKGETE